MSGVPVPPDAGTSYVGVYGLRNPWVAWLCNAAPELAALTPFELQAILMPACYAGESLPQGVTIWPRAPRFDALGHAGDVLDWQRDAESGEYRVLVNGRAET